MKIFVPMPNNVATPMQHMKTLTQRVMASLADLMKDVVGDFDSIRDSFDFRDGALVAQFDSHRGEEDYMLDVLLDRQLLQREFIRVNAADLLTPVLERSTEYRSTNAYLRDNDLVIVHTELSDRGKHKYLDIRFCKLDPRFGRPEPLHR